MPGSDAPPGPPHAFPWRMTLETAAMRSPALPCFLTAHPNQRFVCGVALTPQRAAMPVMPVLREDLSSMDAGGSAEAYYARVPLHHPLRTVLGVVGGCVLTPHCVRSFTRHFDATPENRGALFRWPPAACIWLDFADGETIQPGPEPLVLAMQLISGSISTSSVAASSQSNKMNLVTRVQPRLLKVSSLAKLCGDNGLLASGTRPPALFYPDLVLGTASARGGPTRKWTAGDLWEAASGPREDIMALFETVMRNELKPINTALGIDHDLTPVQAH